MILTTSNLLQKSYRVYKNYIQNCHEEFIRFMFAFEIKNYG
ncbi:hypothetical protein TREVI0001_2320 [Treponema vincentii ATCC 35580]|uniref:Uncharacterized protein n=1 Tax=Treponema vincentii ATCC 35580 TaxID=596324 RepID=C8PM47_9SPIR|nr:hypothetical protein TREVI0001_2320 [Treponema vincentii ATCC 35580]